MAVQAVNEMVGVTMEQEIGSDRQLGKKKGTHGLARRYQHLDIGTTSVSNQRGRGGCSKDEEHMRMCAIGLSVAGTDGRATST